MFDFIIEFIGEFILGIFCQYPGAFIRWIIFRKKTFNEYLESDWYINIIPVAILVALIIILVTIIK